MLWGTCPNLDSKLCSSLIRGYLGWFRVLHLSTAHQLEKARGDCGFLGHGATVQWHLVEVLLVPERSLFRLAQSLSARVVTPARHLPWQGAPQCQPNLSATRVVRVPVPQTGL